MEKVKEYFQIVISFLELIKSKLNQSAWWLAEKFVKLAEKIFGKTRVESFLDYFTGLKKNYDIRIAERIDVEGKYYPFIQKAWKILAFLFFGVIAYGSLLKTNFLYLAGPMPSIEDLQNPKSAQSSEIYTNDKQLIGKFFTENRISIDSAQMSPWLFKALIATEDKRFFQHSGIDLKSMGGVFVGIFSGGERGGGSTISQQLAKNLYNTRKKEMRGLFSYIPGLKQLIYKSKEWLTAIGLEKNFTKGEIMTMYFNTVEFGNNAFGIKTAARRYFDKTPDKLNIQEAAILVGLQKGTTLYNPIRNPANALKRRNTVIQLMADKGDLTNEEANKLVESQIELHENRVDTDKQASYVSIAVNKFIQDYAEKNKEEIDVYADGLKIYTTLDSRMQEFAENAVRIKMKALQKTFDSQWKGQNPWRDEGGKELEGFIEKVSKRTDYYKFLKKKFKNNEDSIDIFMNRPKTMKVFSWDGPKTVSMSSVDSIRYYKRFLQTGMMAFDAHTGFIKAWVGGVDYSYFQYDHVNQGKRQPGSTFKPVVYTAAIDGKLDLSPCSRRKDMPYEAKWKENGIEKFWRPENANGKFSMVELTLRKAIARSVNSVAAKLAEDVGIRTVMEYGQKLGIKSPLQPVGSLALGTSDVSLIELIGMYGAFANEGIHTEPLLVSRIEDRNGKVLYEFQPESKVSIRKETAFLMQYMLRGGAEESNGTGQGLHRYRLFDNGGQVAGKTGTTSNNSDGWYVGFTKDLVCGVWVGGDDRSIHFKGSTGEGASTAMPIFGAFMEKVYGTPATGLKLGPFPKPSVEIKKDYQGCAPAAGSIDYSSEGESDGLPTDSSGGIPKPTSPALIPQPATAKPDTGTL